MACSHVLERTAANILQKIFICVSSRKLAAKKEENLVPNSTTSNIYGRQLWLTCGHRFNGEKKSIYSRVDSIKPLLVIVVNLIPRALPENEKSITVACREKKFLFLKLAALHVYSNLRADRVVWH